MNNVIALASYRRTEVRVGDIVEYHGSITAEHGVFVVVTVGAEGLTIRNHWYPEVSLKRVRPTSVTPTGEWVPVCRCGHPHVHPVNGPTGRCPRPGCECPHHP